MSSKNAARCPLSATRYPPPATRPPPPAASRKPVAGSPAAGGLAEREGFEEGRDEFRATAAIFPSPAARCQPETGSR